VRRRPPPMAPAPAARPPRARKSRSRPRKSLANRPRCGLFRPSLGLIVHELVTNSAKHGALSVPEGRLKISGSVAKGLFTFVWQETGGPPAREPARKGLGHIILHDVARDFCERVEATYAEAGFRYELAARIEKLTSNVIDLAERRSSEG